MGRSLKVVAWRGVSATRASPLVLRTDEKTDQTIGLIRKLTGVLAEDEHQPPYKSPPLSRLLESMSLEEAGRACQLLARARHFKDRKPKELVPTLGSVILSKVDH